MFKYEVEISVANDNYQEYLKDSQWEDIAEFMAYHGNAYCQGKTYENIGVFSVNTRIAIIKYYTFVKGTGFIRIKDSIKGGIAFGIDRSDRDQFEKNKIDYPHKEGLYLLGQTFFNPITDEKFYWVKPGTASDLKRRRREYNTPTAMIWDIDYYIGNELTENGCHQKLKAIAIHRHADEWFSVSRENYLAICEQGFDWFKEA